MGGGGCGLSSENWFAAGFWCVWWNSDEFNRGPNGYGGSSLGLICGGWKRGQGDGVEGVLLGSCRVWWIKWRGGNLAGWPGGYDGMSTGSDKGVKVTPELHTTV